MADEDMTNGGIGNEGMTNLDKENSELDTETDEVVKVKDYNKIFKTEQYIPYSTKASNSQSLTGEKDMLIEKLNYMIHLLEEQQQDKTDHIAEELILYTF